MNWNKFLTYGDSQQNAFETLCNQIFERYLKTTYAKDLTKFRVINGAGGDGGIEAYGLMTSDKIIAIQSKWFRDVLKDAEFAQIKKSITTAKVLRPHIQEYIICIPHDVSSLKYGRGKMGAGKKPVDNFEEKAIDTFTIEIQILYPDLKITWWLEKDIEFELMTAGNEGIHKFWFDQEVISLTYLKRHFDLQKNGWLYERYVPELNGQGIIYREYQAICLLPEHCKNQYNILNTAISDIRFCTVQINKFIPTNSTAPQLNSKLESVRDNLLCFAAEIENMATSIISGNDYYRLKDISEVDIWEVAMELEKLKPTNFQKNILPTLIATLENIHKIGLSDFLLNMNCSFTQNTRLVLGEPGTGKTQGLSNCVEVHLGQNSPAIIIQAKGSSCRNWTEILSKSLELPSWNKGEIFSALETLAIKNDIQNAIGLQAGDELQKASTKVLICIDGLDEDIENQKEWYNRIRQCEQLILDHPRLRFIFSARRYFYDNRQVPESTNFEQIFLPRDGDVRVMEIAPKYFSEEHYNIKLSSYSIIKGIDSLLALRLFCEKYRNQTLTDTIKIITATRDLLNEKIYKTNEEFRSAMAKRKGATRNPVPDALDLIASHFYNHIDVEHDELVKLILSGTASYMDTSEIDQLIDYLSNNAFLIKSERIKTKGTTRKSHHYNITYQSLIEHLISEKAYEDIKAGSLNRIPEILHHGMIRPFDFENDDMVEFYQGRSNKRIIQNIVTNLFIETGKLIGIDNFLIDGFSEIEVKQLQYNAISLAPFHIAKKYKSDIDRLFNADYTERSYILQYLVYPSSYSAQSFFGADYLHNILINQKNAFERDKMLSGLDSYEIRKLTEAEKSRYRNGAIEILFDADLELESTFLSDEYLHNERPLIFAWGLSTLDQNLRNRLRIALTGWAIKQPLEFVLLLDKIFLCNDPQIQEDLGSIMLGVASKIKDREKVKILAQWALANVFSHLEVHRNIIIRQGFRAIVERAFQFGVITKTDVKKCRPMRMQEIFLLPLYQDFTLTNHTGAYPIVSDLAWYVIDNAYEDFLEYPSDSKDRNCREAKALMRKYITAYGKKKIYPNNWGMATGIEYIRSLGLTRPEGNGHTQATHGGKSKIFTFEEKYTWLAVHYIQGYLADYIPYKTWNDQREFIKDYTQLTDIPNPSDLILDVDDVILQNNTEVKKEWVIKEELSKEFKIGSDAAIEDSITEWVNEEPNLDFDNWLNFYSSDFLMQENKQWTAVYNYTSLHDSQEIGYSHIDIRACLISPEDLISLKQIIGSSPDDLHFIRYLDGLQSIPRTSTYCNPTDIVWMTWIEEDGVYQEFYDKKTDEERKFFFGVTKIVQNNNGNEKFLKFPSKRIRELINCYELKGNTLIDIDGNIKAFRHEISSGLYSDNQEIVLVESGILKEALTQNKYELIWFVNYFKEKNPLNKILDKKFHVQKTRKYLVWSEQEKTRHIKFWDDRFSNQRD